MIQQLEDLSKHIATKPTWSAKDLVSKIQGLDAKLTNELADSGQLIKIVGGKTNKVSSVKKYDVLYVQAMGVPHYFLVHRVIDQVVYGIVFTSTNKPAFCIHEVKKDRILEGSFATNSYLSISLDQALNSYIRTYETKSEANEIFSKVIAHFKVLFK
jgi:hypothetical protein